MGRCGAPHPCPVCDVFGGQPPPAAGGAGRAAPHPADLAPAIRRDADELEGFLEFLAADLAHPGLRATVLRFFDDKAIRPSEFLALSHEEIHALLAKEAV